MEPQHPVEPTIFGADGVPIHWKPGYDHTGPAWRAYDKARGAKPTKHAQDIAPCASLAKKR